MPSANASILGPSEVCIELSRLDTTVEKSILDVNELVVAESLSFNSELSIFDGDCSGMLGITGVRRSASRASLSERSLG